MSARFSPEQWALILGGSSGFGLAAAERLAADGMSVAVVHRDRRGRLAEVEAAFAAIRQSGARLMTFNADALAPLTQDSILDAFSRELPAGAQVRLLLHSIANGNLKPLVTSHAGAELTLGDEDFVHTLYAMGTSLASWVRKLHALGLFADDARVLGLTSEGSTLAWPNYAAVSAAKAALEALIRAMALEYGPLGLRCNVLQPGVTETAALRLIPGFEALLASALERNPLGRLTRPEDVAGVISFLCSDDARFINGAVLRVDGGEAIAG
jgi:enoyl-[acyl-carrier protein] reductase I